jgi:electron transport complex protein RnfB
VETDSTEQDIEDISRRQFVRGAGFLGLGGLIGALAGHRHAQATVWQLDPNACVSCGRCATDCVLEKSAVTAVHSHDQCGYCELCTAYFEPDPLDLDTGAENQLCPTGAIKRTFVEEPYFEYHIDEALCIGCGKCVQGCTMFGNGSMRLQVRHDRCLNCNECSIAVVCPAQAYRRVSADDPILLRGEETEDESTPDPAHA